MTGAQIGESVKRLLVFFNPTPEQASQYISMLQESIGWMEPFRFEMVCVEMLKTRTDRRKPSPPDFVAIYRRLQNEQGWDKDKSFKKPMSPAEHHDHMMRVAQEMKPAGARWVLAQVEKGRVKFPEDVYMVLLEQAGKDAPAMVESKPNLMTEVIDKVEVEEELPLV